ncbi:gliding motility-associated C-terminal domain-containing protein [Pedobacter polaris]|uniref:Gliding motility-associated C-terminal domain-containing protein n=1 Tax=Pedobacter polaris TaxID=2571273 RepID=A0A4U1CWR8_9SPHI|nr:MBG domain-containing protein [Pedobacter polaris]TKC10779.1 gliding motility-associated C-terminal domain-containing protein [Pedobacter polaris]
MKKLLPITLKMQTHMSSGFLNPLRKLILLISFLLGMLPAYGQVIFFEDFDHTNGPTAGGAGTYVFPSGWLLFNLDGRTPNPTVNYVNQAWERRDDFSHSVLDSAAFSTSYYSPIGQADDWMWTPEITIPLTSGTIRLNWNAVAQDPVYRDGYEVRIMASPNVPTGSYSNLLGASVRVFSIAEENSSWTNREIALDAYKGQKIRIAFRNNSVDKFLLLIDDVKVEEKAVPYTPLIAPNANIVYVNRAINSGSANGSSWANAVPELADALKFVKTNNAVATNPQVTQIWVAKGTYKPLYSPADNNFGNPATRDNSFLLVKDVKIYGGFDPDNGINNLANRNPKLAITTLSGDFNGDDVISGFGSTLSIINNSENAYHVLISAGTVGTAQLDGFTVNGGNANGFSGLINVNSQAISKFSGGGMYNNLSSANINQCTFSGNNANYGGGMLNITSSLIIDQCNFSGNSAISDGGGMYNSDSSPIITLNIFSGNIANNRGGGMYNSVSSPKLFNCLFAKNSSPNTSGGAIWHNDGVSALLQNCTIYGNSANGGNTGGLYVENGRFIVQNSLLWANQGLQYLTAGVAIITLNNNLIDGKTNTVNGNISATGITTAQLFTDAINGDYSLKFNSPAIGAGSNSLYEAADGNTGNSSLTTNKDLAGNSRLKGTNIDLGAYELQSQPQTINPTANITKTYGDANFEPGATSTSGLTISYTSADNSIAEAFQDAVDGNKWKINIKKAGTVNITATQAGNGSYDPATPVVFNLIANKKPVTLALTSVTISKEYDGNINATITTSDLSFVTGSIVGTDDLSILLTSTTANYDDKNVGVNKVVNIPLGNLNLNGTSAGNYNIANTTNIIANVGTITQKALTVKANNQTKTYDGAPYSGGNGVAYTGFALGDNEINALNGILEYEGTSQGAINTGNYTIVPKGYTSNNYNITYTNGNLLVTASIANVLSFNAQTGGTTILKTYGDGSINASAVASSNLAASYGSSNTAVASINAQGQVEIKGTGTALITASQAGDINFQPAPTISFTVQVNKKTLDVKANDYSKTYNGIPYSGGNGLSYTGFVYGESSTVLGGTVIYTGTSQGAVNTGNYQIIPSGLTANNYDLNYIAGTLNIIQSGSNVITFNSQIAGSNLNVTYGNGNIDASAVATSGLTVSYQSNNPAVAQVAANGTVTVLGAGVAMITTTQPGDSNQAAATPISFTINVAKKGLTITANNANKVYNAQAYAGGNGVSYTGFVTGESQINLQGVLSYTGMAIGATTVGSYFISPTGYTSNNYAITYQDGSLTITKAGLTITADAKNKTYGDNEPAFTYTVTGLIGTDGVTGLLVRTAGENVGSYAINLGSLTAGGNYSINYTPANLSIGQKTLTITANNQFRTYDGTAYIGGNGLSIAGFANGDNETNLQGAIVYSGTAQGAINTGTYTIIPSGLSNVNYAIAFANGTLTIGNSLDNTLSFNAQTVGSIINKIYGDASINASAVASSGLPASYQSSNTAVATVGANGQVNIVGVGTAAITASQPGNNNYIAATSISFDIIVIKKVLTVSANDFTKIYDGNAYNGGNGVLYSGFVNGEGTTVLNGSLSYTGTAQGALNKGTYTIIPAGLSANNYNFNYVAGTLSIEASGNNVITFNSQTAGGTVSAIYGDVAINAKAVATSGLGVSYASSNPLVASVDVNGLVRILGAGTSIITASQLGDANHQPATSINFTLNIQKKALIITANNTSKIYDGIAFTGGNGISYLGFVHGENEQSLQGSLSYLGTAQGAKNVNSYFIVPSGYASNNYAITYQSGSLTITKASLNIIAQAKSKIYGEADPFLTYAVTGLVGTDAISGSLARVPSENVGDYAINMGSLSASPNYTISYNGANLTIIKALLTVTAENKQICQNNGLPVFTVLYTGFKFGDNANNLSIKPTVSTAANSNSPAGNYLLTPTGGLSANYNFNYVNGSFIVFPTPVPSITNNTTNNVSKGETLVLTANGGTSYTWANTEGIVSGRNTAALTIRPTVTTTYTVTVSNANGCSEALNYTVEVRDDFQAISATNILTPNGDGINDLWVVKNIDMYPNNVVTIFDRAGRILFTQKGYQNTWDGTVNGSSLAENTYYYVIDFGTNKLKQKGYITLIRE